ncbi:MAG: polA [Chlamydiales bacterium]|jgi:DNA polymerase-1|nr:polA [Chlamydiales bacterium]
MDKIYLIDASGVIYRSYFALPPMNNPQGVPTQALFGFARALIRLQKDFLPQHIVAIFDGINNKQKRTEIYADYKSHRKETPPDLISQIHLAQDYCKQAGIPHLAVPNVEADDTIGSIALWAAGQGAEVYICSSDKDLCQLVSSKIKVIHMHKDNLIIDEKGVEEIYGIPPHQIVDYLAITGDASDNIPGITGFGPKTAVTLLKQFGSLENILASIEKVSGQKKQDTLRQEADIARLSKDLATLHTDVEFPQDESFFYLNPTRDLAPLKTFYQQMGFQSLIKELVTQEQRISRQDNSNDLLIPTYLSPVQKQDFIKDYQTINSIEQLKELCEYLNSQTEEICFDTETTGLEQLQASIVGVGLGVKPGQSWYIPFNSTLDSSIVLKFLKPLFENRNLNFYGHNVKYDLHILANHGIAVANISFDTMIASYLLHPDTYRHNLDDLSIEHFQYIKVPIESLIGKGKKQISMLEVPLLLISNYCCEDVDMTCRLKYKLEEELKQRDLFALLKEVELPLIKILFRMERAGIYVDTEFLKKLGQEVETQLSRLENNVYELAGEQFNLNSPKQLSQILYEKLQLSLPKKGGTSFSTGADILESIKWQHPIVSTILEYRSLEKLRSTYINSLIESVNSLTHRIHCNFNQVTAATGRLACQNPNLQNIPVRTEIGRMIRHAFHPQFSEYYFLAADYSQIELRILAHLSEDPLLINAFNEGLDIHKSTAAQIFHIPIEEVTHEQRYQAKAINFGIVYGQQAYGLSQQLNISVKEAAEFIEQYFHKFPRIRQYLEEQKEVARKTFQAKTMMNRQRPIPDILHRNGMIRQASERLAINTPIQGSAADLIKIAMQRVSQEIDKQELKAKMLLQIHDELLFEVHQTELESLQKLVKNEMQGVWQLKVPLIIDIAVGKNWEEC